MRDSRSPVTPEKFAWYRTRAAVLVRSPEDLRALGARAGRKLAGSSAFRLGAVRDELVSLVALLKAYADGSYRGISNRSLIAVAAAILYFVIPLDLVPDFILGLGLADDAAVIGYVLSMVRGEVNDFVAWQSQQGSGTD